jgi:hypothetical protein
MNWIKSIFSKIEAYFASAQGKQAIEDINTLVQVALPIVEEISALTGNAGACATVAAVTAAYTKYGVPLEQTLVAGDQQQVGNALLNLATSVLQKNLPANKAGIATNLLNTAVSLAVTASKVSL